MGNAATLQELTNQVSGFIDQRDWSQFHNPKDLALSLSLEAAEVLELMQWKQGDELQSHLTANSSRLGEELADVFFWVLVLSNQQGIDLAEAFQRKMVQNGEKYPVELAKGKSSKYTELR
ncbi:MAG: nucleotide pyrophosphohydrolase [Chlorobia bacterium]|nr:nucleotide pyrophosphohydrolase [Fimbriimonadaceae bacterium]